MGRKNTCRATKIKDDPVFSYQVGIDLGAGIKEFIIKATYFMEMNGTYEFYLGRGHDEIIIASFRNCHYVLLFEENFKEKFEGLKRTSDELPEEFGMVR